jgi:hypothetical protein
MSQSRTNSKLPLRGINVLLLLLFLLFLTSIAGAMGGHAANPDLLGKWSGVISTPKGKAPATLDVRADDSFELDVGGSEKCLVTMTKGWVEQDTLVLDVTETTGSGFCNDLWKKNMGLQLQADKHLKMIIPYPLTDQGQEALFTRE